MHLLLLEECNAMWDVIAISKAINYLHENDPFLSGISTEEDLRAYEETFHLRLEVMNGVSPSFFSISQYILEVYIMTTRTIQDSLS